ncbi:hypothetical protein [Amycolatopsis sp. cmx-4-54]|uniref:hypothetical protein n=1 Tax=Amycolatopsis sp. cmx-4-54 TaxID=2790936 RepID=UPI00397AEDD9
MNLCTSSTTRLITSAGCVRLPVSAEKSEAVFTPPATELAKDHFERQISFGGSTHAQFFDPTLHQLLRSAAANAPASGASVPVPRLLQRGLVRVLAGVQILARPL